ncbi:hypothetical protein D3C87_125020 [compost metagenome]
MKSILLSLFSVLLISPAHGQVIEGKSAPGLNAKTNYVLNSDAEKVLKPDDVVNASGILGRTSTSPLKDAYSYTIDATASGQVVEFKTALFDQVMKGENCLAYFRYDGDASLYKAYVKQGFTALEHTSQQLKNTTADKGVYSYNFSCGDLSSPTQLAIESTSASAAPIKVDVLYVGEATNQVAVLPRDSYSIVLDSAGGILSQTPGFASSCTKSATGTYSCVLNVDLGPRPSCLASSRPASTSAGSITHRVEGSGKALSVVTFLNAALNDRDSAITCTLTDNYSTPTAIAAIDWDYKPRTFTPTFTGLGTVSGVTCTEGKMSVYNVIECSWTNGTIAASEARVSLPHGRLVASDFSAKIVGEYYRDTSLANNMGGPVLAYPGNSYVNFGGVTFAKNDATSFNPLSPTTGTGMSSNGNTMRFVAWVRIQGWQPSQGVGTINGVTTTTDNYRAPRRSFAIFYGVGTSSSCTSGLCNLGPSSTPDITVTKTGTGLYDLDFNPPYTSSPACQLTWGINDTGTQLKGSQDIASSTGAKVKTAWRQASGTAADTRGIISCDGYWN